MGTKLSVSRKSFFGCTTAPLQMAEANTSVSDSESTSTRNSCDCKDSAAKSKASKKSFPLGCMKKSKAQEEHDGTKSRSDKHKTRSGWSLRWRMKSPRSVEDEATPGAESVREPMINLERFNPEDYPIEDRDELARLERAREIAEGIEMEIDSLPSFYRGPRVENADTTEASIEGVAEAVGAVNESAATSERGAILFDGLTVLLHRSLAISIDSQRAWNVLSQLDLHFLAQHYNWHQHQQGPQGMFTLTPRSSPPVEPVASNASLTNSEDAPPQQLAHTQVDYLHCLVPDLLDITKCSFYWGKMDRYEAERLLENKPDGTFLLRDSAQEEYLFSVSFRRYNRSLHARIEQWNHRFSFDSHDPGVFSSPTILGLIDHYKNPELCMFFEPTLTLPLHRNIPFSLQHLCRAVVCNTITYDGIGSLALPKPLKLFLKEYHYKQRIRVRRLDL